MRDRIKTAKTIKIFKYDKDIFNNVLTENVIYEDNKDLNENVKLLDACLESTILEFTFEKQVHIKNKVNNWFNEELRTMKREKIIKYLQAKFENTNQA